MDEDSVAVECVLTSNLNELTAAFLLKCELGFGQSWRDTESGPAGKAGLVRCSRYKTRVGGSGGLPYIYIYVYTWAVFDYPDMQSAQLSLLRELAAKP